MRRTTTLVVLLALITSAVAVPVGAAGQPTAQTNATADAQASANSSVAPGEQMAGVVGVTEAEFEGEIEERTFGVRIAQNASANAQSDVVADQLDDVEQRVAELEQRKERLEAAHENGSMTEGEFRAEMAVVATEKETATRLAANSETVASGLSPTALDRSGISLDGIVTLRERAQAVGGENVSAYARSIGGVGVGIGSTAQVDIDAEGDVSVDVPGISLGADADASGDAETSSDNESGDGSTTEADSETEVSGETDDGTSVEVDSETNVSTDL